MKHIFECHDILMLGKSPTKWRQRLDMTIAVDWDVKRQFKQINKLLVYFQREQQVHTTSVTTETGSLDTGLLYPGNTEHGS